MQMGNGLSRDRHVTMNQDEMINLNIVNDEHFWRIRPCNLCHESNSLVLLRLHDVQSDKKLAYIEKESVMNEHADKLNLVFDLIGR